MLSNTSLPILSRLSTELGLLSIYHSPGDTKLLCLLRFVRLFAFGLSTLILVLHLSRLGVADSRIGLFMTLTLLGDVGSTSCLTILADGLGRRTTLVLAAALMTASGIVFALCDSYWALLAASVLGIMSPSGAEIGPFRAVEESTLAHLTPPALRSDIFTWYTLCGKAGTALGTLACGWAAQALQQRDGWTATHAHRVLFGAYAVLGLLHAFLPLLLSPACERRATRSPRPERPRADESETTSLLPAPQAAESKVPSHQQRGSLLPTLSPSSRPLVLRLGGLFAIEAFASGLVPASWIAYFFTTTHGMQPSALGTLLALTALISTVSILLAAPLARRIGLVRTMVFTHLPSAVCLALIPLPCSLPLAALLLVLRSCTQSMDQAPREAFLSAVVRPGERTAVMGVLGVVKTLSQSVAPSVTGGLVQGGRFWVGFVVAGALKVGYDLGVLAMFVGWRGREEDGAEENGGCEGLDGEEGHGEEGHGEEGHGEEGVGRRVICRDGDGDVEARK
ncbi:hypothetical protein MMC26_005832 [Xylographa opegraphella]|nr:hypothetical protein [Xylographa opegraphella]